MNITITSRKTTVKDSFKERVEKKLAKFDRFFDDEAVATVTVTNEKNRETVEVTIRYNALIFRAEKTSGDRIESLDGVVDILFKQIVKNKSKLELRVKAKAFDGISLEKDFPEEHYNIIKHKKFPVLPMNVEEAVLQMNMLDHEFFMFENPETGIINVVYRRKNGDYGLLEPVR